MRGKERPGNLFKERKGERGAALVMVLMMSFLLLVAAIALLLESSMNTANVTDATSEEQAYYAAESGIQTVVDVLRGGTCPNPLYTANCFPNDPNPLNITALANKIDYFKAIKLATSNAPGDTSTVARLSRWLPYTDPTNPNSTVLLGGNGSPFRFRVEVENPDNLGNSITYRTDQRPDKMYPGTMPAGCLVDPLNRMAVSCLDDATTNTVRIEYVPIGINTINVSSGEAPAPLGSWRISGTGPSFDANGARVPARIRFAIYVNVISVQNTTKIIRGYLEPGLVKAGNVGTARVFYDSKNFVNGGSLISISDAYGGTIIQEDPDKGDTPTGEGGTYRTGFVTTPIAPPAGGGSGETLVNSTMTAPEPTRLVIRSTGFGPHGSVKRLEAVIQRNYFNGLGAPSPLTLIGPPCTPAGTCIPSTVAPSFVFQPGSSTGTKYDGKDIQLMAFLPPVGLTNDPNVLRVSNRLIQPPPNRFNGSVFGTPTNIADELPFWLQNPRNLQTTLTQLRASADASGSLYEVAEPRPAYGNGNYGDYNTASGITYVEGDLEFAQEGGGILVVTGTLTFKGGFQFNGLIVVTGPGGILRTGGGNGSLQGNIIVAPYDNWSLNTCMTNPTVMNKLDCFYAPRYDISGGGGSDITYNSNNVKNGLGALTNFVKGVAEK